VVVTGFFVSEGAGFFFFLAFLDGTDVALLSLCAKASKGPISSAVNKNAFVILSTVAS